VTHDQVEAMTMGHRVAVLRDGRLQQVDTPERLYDAPVNTFVASSIGSPAITLVDSPVREGVAHVHGVPVPLDRTIAARAGERVVVGLRPESWHIVESGSPDSLPLNVELVESLGAESFVYGRPADGGTDVERITVRVDKRTHLAVGDVVHVQPSHQEAHVFDAQTGERISA
jgi:sn-glycerol 3-phosphate transport system ATP-binding protein/multiple sugar transport system ATP-binding protein